MNTYIIYKLTFPNNKVYIGQTKLEFKGRLNQYKSDAYNKNRKFYNSLVCKAIRKYGWNIVQKEILLTTSEEFVDELETKMIDEYKSTDRKFGYNLDSGGNKNKHRSKETILKISGKNHPMWGKENIKLTELNKIQKGKNHPMFGRFHTIETKEKQSKSHMNKGTKSIKVYTIINEYITTFKSIKQASKNLDIFATSISAVLNNKRKSAGGYFFRYNLENINV